MSRMWGFGFRKLDVSHWNWWLRLQEVQKHESYHLSVVNRTIIHAIELLAVFSTSLTIACTVRQDAWFKRE